MDRYRAHDLLDLIYRAAQQGNNHVRNMADGVEAIQLALDVSALEKRNECVWTLRRLITGDQSETDITLQKAIDIIEGRVQ